MNPFITPDAEWFHEPEWRVEGDELAMHAVQGSDLWQHTTYGFDRDTGHALRVSVAEDFLTVRARPDGGTWRLVRLVPFTASSPVRIGPYACSPGRAGYVARFRDLAMTAAGSNLH